jgi:hypothetical protein
MGMVLSLRGIFQPKAFSWIHSTMLKKGVTNISNACFLAPTHSSSSVVAK